MSRNFASPHHDREELLREFRRTDVLSAIDAERPSADGAEAWSRDWQASLDAARVELLPPNWLRVAFVVYLLAVVLGFEWLGEVAKAVS